MNHAPQTDKAQIASELKTLLSRAFGSRLSEVILFGSLARGTETPESDVDTLVVLEPFESYATELRTALEAVYPLSIRLGRRVSVKPIPLTEYHHADTPILTAIRHEGIPA
jgi:predicted nucleotidyltransferase